MPKRFLSNIQSSTIVLTLVIILGVILRFYQLSLNPPSLDWDEASIGYNAYSILKTGADEYGNKLPLSIRSFDDYKPPLYIYLTIPSIAIFGLTEFAVRLPSALLGSLTIILVYLLVKLIFNEWSLKSRECIALLSAFFIAVSPWHLQFSRAAFEGNIGLFFFTLGVLFFLRGLEKGKYLLLSGVCFVLSIYSYHSFKLIGPVFLLSASFLYYKQLLNKRKIIIVSAVVALILVFPMFFDLLSSSKSLSRFSMVTIFSPHGVLEESIKRIDFDKANGNLIGALLHNRRIVYGLLVAKGYLDHFNPDFLFIHGDGGRQHHAVEIGMLYLWELLFIVLGFIFLLKKTNKKVILIFIWLFVAPLASAVSTGTPHPVRAIAMLIPLHILTAAGVVKFIDLVKNYSKNISIQIGFLLLAFILFVLNFIYYLHQYYVHTPIEYGNFWQYGYKQLFKEASKLENSYRKIIVTYKYDQPYIYYLFYNKIDPAWYQKNWDHTGTGKVKRFKRIIGKYEFRNINWDKDKNLKNSLIIAAPQEIPENADNIIKVIKFLDGKKAFIIVKT
jgi:4-amino-4-deoxy-L-arabinose transferase-like glycosyltransferase